MGKEFNSPDMNAITSNGIIAYRVAIENLARNFSTKVFGNASASHAAIVMGNIFKTSNKAIKIFSGNFNGAISDNPYYLDGLKSFLDKGRELDIIFENEPNRDSKALGLIKASNNCNISIKKLNKTAKVSSLEHFIIGDGKMFRLETSKENYEAICSFNNPDSVKKLEAIYARLQLQSSFCGAE